MRNIQTAGLVFALALLAAPCVAQRKAAGNRLESALIADERRVIWEAVVKRRLNVLRDSLADDFLDVSDVGVFTKSETIKLIPDLEIRDYSLGDFKVLLLGKDAAVVTYTAPSTGR